MRQLAPLAVVYLLVAALIVPASPFAADDVKTEPEAAAPPPTETVTTTAEPPAQTETAPQPAAPQPAESAPPAAEPESKPVARAASPGSVTIKDFSFGPGTISVNVGDTVTWTNSGPSGHSATARDGSFDTGVLSKGKRASHTFSKAGSFSYICTPHPFMKGTVNVTAASSGGGSSKGSGSAASPSSGTAGGSAAAPGSSTASGSSGSVGSSSGASLPKTGADAGALAVLGALLLGLGAAVRRRSPSA